MEKEVDERELFLSARENITEYEFENRERLTWNNGYSDMFLLKKADGKYYLLCYDEFNYRKIHELCGGKHYYHSNTKDVGFGYITHVPENMMRVGFYRTDIPLNESQHPVEIKAGIKVMVPWKAHTENKASVLKKYPTVITFGLGIGHQNVAYCDFFDTFPHVLKQLLDGGKIWGENLVRYMINPKTYLQDRVVIGFADYFGWSDEYNPWEFVDGETSRAYQINGPVTDDEHANHTARLNDGTPVKIGKMNKTFFAKNYFFNGYEDDDESDECNKEKKE